MQILLHHKFNDNKCCIEMEYNYRREIYGYKFNDNKCCIEITDSAIKVAKDEMFNDNKCCIEILQFHQSRKSFPGLMITNVVLKFKTVVL